MRKGGEWSRGDEGRGIEVGERRRGGKEECCGGPDSESFDPCLPQ